MLVSADYPEFRIGIRIITTYSKKIMNFPKLQKGQYAVLKAKTCPGNFLGLGPHVDLSHGRWRVFQNLDAAHRYATTQVAAQPSVECGIYNAQSLHVRSVRL